ncbi:TetR/AcrR family transcriptional regulator [Psychrobacillus sp. BM2]|uniref:TetR/AcrR family transcriptional regulator n=1 Tax=Psychrobacillus sp. BM2 TaxID=3400421 RepID=UPI003B02AC67
MAQIDRRVKKSQYAIKNAFVELMAEKNLDQITMQDISDRANVGRRTIYDHYMDKYDLLDKLIKEHINELRKICESASEMSFAEGNLIWFDYFERHYTFFSTMLSSKGAPAFRNHFLEFVIQELEGELVESEGKNQGLSKELVLRFFGAAIVEIVEAWLTNGLSEPTQVISEQMGSLLDRNF